MPLIYQKYIDGQTTLALWHITEGETFFAQKVNLQTDIAHPHKRLQHLAGRMLLKELQPAFPLQRILIAGNKRPFLPDDSWRFSISHCGDFAAAIISESRIVGIDAEITKPVIEKISYKFIGETEKNLLLELPCTYTQALTIAWSAKEAMFKWYALGKVDFKADMQLLKIELWRNHVYAEAMFGKEVRQKLQLYGRMADDLVLMWIST